MTLPDLKQISVQIAKCFVLESGNRRWKIRDFKDNCRDVNIVAKMDVYNVTPMHYYIMRDEDVKFAHFIDYDKINPILTPYKNYDICGFLAEIIPNYSCPQTAITE